MSGDIHSVVSYVGGFVAGVVGWIATHLTGKPYLEYRELCADIADCLIRYANVPHVGSVMEPVPLRTIEARTKYKDLAGKLMGCANKIAFYRVWSFLFILPKWEELEEAKRNLTGLSNSIGEKGQELEIGRRVDKIRGMLRIR